MSRKERLSDAEFEALKSTINQTIHELVFACQHLDQDDLEDAQQCLMTAQGNLERVGEKLAEMEESQSLVVHTPPFASNTKGKA